MTADELKVFEQCTGRSEPPTKQPSEIYTICGRRAGKSFVSAVVACYLACFESYQKYLNAGERGVILVLAVDKEQARVIFSYVAGIIRAIPALSQMVVNEKAAELELSTGVNIMVRASDFRSVRGLSIVAAICDEAAFWPDQGLNPSSEVFVALRPAMATIPNSKLLCISTPYARAGTLFEMHREHYGQSNSDILVWQVPTARMNPTIRTELIEGAIAKDAHAGRSEWLAEFREDLEAAFSLESIEQCVIQGRTELPPSPTIPYKGFCDPSGGRSDAFAVSIAHEEDGKVVVDVARTWQAPFDPGAVVAEASELLKSYGVLNVTGDNYGGEWPVASFRERGIGYTRAEKPKSELYLSMIPVVNAHNIELPDNRKLIDELRRLERRRGRTGKDVIDHPNRGSDDLSNAVAGAAWLLSTTDKTAHRDTFNPQAHISRLGLKFVAGSWPLVAGVSADDNYVASVIAQSYDTQVRVFYAAVTEGLSLRQHLEMTKAWLASNSPKLVLLGAHEYIKALEGKSNPYDACPQILQGRWTSISDDWPQRLDKMRDALTKCELYSFKPLIQFSPTGTTALTAALNSGRYRDKAQADKRNWHLVNSFTLLLARLEIWKRAPKDSTPRRLPPSAMSA